MPYIVHPNLATPPDDTVLWKYLDFAKFVSILETKSLWFSRANLFEDPLEGTYTDAELEHWRNLLAGENFHGSMMDGSDLITSVTYVDCWRQGDSESLAMWDLYGKGSGIVAIKTTVGSLKAQYAAFDGTIYLAKVNYVDWNSATWSTNAFEMLARKEASYGHESEVRAMITEFGHVAQTPNRVPGIALPIDPSALISEVIVGPREKGWVLSLVQKTVERYGLPVTVRSSNRLRRRSWSLTG